MIFQLSTEELAFLLPALVMSLTIHEYAHARVALYFGDPTAKMLGRVTLNPMKHLDLFGTVALLLVGFGWAKPVPVNPRNMRNPRLGEIMVSFAGPASNMLLAIVSAVALRIILSAGDGEDEGAFAYSATRVLIYLAAINTGLCVLNLIPIYPLDGHHIVRELLPASQRIPFMEWQVKYGTLILLILVFGPDVLGRMGGRGAFDPLEWVIGCAQEFIFKIIE